MSALAHFTRRESRLQNGKNTSSDTLFISSGIIHAWWGAFLVVTWQWLGPLYCRDDLLPPQPVESGHEPRGGVGQRAVVARVDDLWLDGLEHRQHGGHKLGHAPGDDWNRHVVDGLWWSRTLLHLHLDQLLVFPRWGTRRERAEGKERKGKERKGKERKEGDMKTRNQWAAVILLFMHQADVFSENHVMVEAWYSPHHTVEQVKVQSRKLCVRDY